MKKTVLAILLTITYLYSSNNLTILNSEEDSEVVGVEISGNGESCSLYYDGMNQVGGSCISMFNSKGVKIFCTSNKNMCKTSDEIHSFIFHPKPLSLSSTTNSNTYTDPKVVKPNNYSEKNTLTWRDVRITNPYFVKEWIKNGISTPEEAQKWKNAGFQSAAAGSWKSLGANSPDEAQKWMDAGFDRTDVYSWRDRGVNSLEEVKKWKELGFDYFKVAEWKNKGINTPEEVKKWIELRLNRFRVKEWQNSSVNTPEEVKKWIGAGFNHQAAGFWKGSGVNTPEEATKWKDAGFGYIEAGRWIKIGINTPEEANIWIENGIYNPSKALNYIKNDVLPKDAAWNETKQMMTTLLIFLCMPILGVFIFFLQKLFKNSKKIWEDDRYFWFTDQEKEIFKSQYNTYKNHYDEEYNLYSKQYNKYEMERDSIYYEISNLHQEARDNNINENVDGSYSRKSNIGKKIQDKIDYYTNSRKELKRPIEPEFYFSESNLSIQRWKNFNQLWQLFNQNYKTTKALLWTLYTCILSIIFIGMVTSHPTIYSIGIGSIIVSIISFKVIKRVTKNKLHKIPCPPSITIENIDTPVKTYIPIDICKDIKCFWNELNKLGS